MNKLLLEEMLFEEDVEEITEDPVEEESTEETPVEDETTEPEITDDNLDQVVADAEGEEVPEEPTTTYKVTFTLGKHTNWSRVDATNEEDAAKQVADYVTKKWPDRDFEVTDIDEFEEMEESLNESLENDPMEANKIFVNGKPYITFEKGTPQSEIDKVAYELKHILGTKEVRVVYEDGSTYNMKVESLDESLGEVTDAQPIEDGACVGMASVISDLIKDEYEAIDGYNSAIATAEAEGFGDMVNVLTEIQAEENLHIGQLQAIMNTLDPNSHLVDDGQAEGVEQLSNPLSGVNESVDRNVEIGRPDYSVDMTDDEYEDFRNVLTKHYGSPEAFFKRLHAFTPDFEIHRVDYDDIPEDTITLGSTDISQGTGNVIVYTAMGRDTGKIYRYADF